MVVQALGNAFQAFSQLQQALADKEMKKFEKNNDKKKKELLKQLNEGTINQEEYHKQVQLMEAETANKKAEIAYKQAKTERALKIVEIIANTSLAIMQAYSQLGPIGGTIAAVLIGTLGALQLGTVVNTPLPEKPSFADGGFGKDEFEGFSGNGFGTPDESGERKARLAWIHEKEWTAPRWMTEHPVLSKKINELEYVRKNKIKSFADGGFGSDTVNTNPVNPLASVSDPQLTYALMQFIEMMNGIKEEGLECYMVESADNGKRIKRTIKLFDQIETRNAGK